MTKLALGRLSRISFQTDMTRASAPVIPLGFILEAAWETQARWMGLIGRTRLTDYEKGHINFHTWPDLRTPFTLLDSMFDKGWEADWGTGGEAIERDWLHSAIRIETSEKAMSERFRIDSQEAWDETDRLLFAELSALASDLAPLAPSKAPVSQPAKIISLRPITPLREMKQVEAPKLLQAA